jgi:hypothetical protein
VIFLNFQDFRTSPAILAVALGVVIFVLAQSTFFLVKSWKKGKELGISTETLKNTVMSSAVFTVAPAISILATVLVLANALGLVLPWIRLTVIGNLAYETTAAQTSLDFWGATINSAVGDKEQFATIAWAMTLGSIAPLLLIPFLCKKLQKTVGKAVNKTKTQRSSVMPFRLPLSSASFSLLLPVKSTVTPQQQSHRPQQTAVLKKSSRFRVHRVQCQFLFLFLR